MTRKAVVLCLTTSMLLASCASDSDDGNASPTTRAASASAESVPSRDTSAAEAQETPPEQLDRVRIQHPETLAFAAPFALLDEQGALAEVAEQTELSTWTSPDVLRSTLVNGKSDVTAVPTYLGANLYNRGIDVRLAAVVVWGLLWLVGPEEAEPSWESLRGQTVLVPFRGDMPDLVFRHLAQANGLEPGSDFEVEYYAQAPEVVARLLAGQGEWAVLPEHVVTVVLDQVSRNGVNLGRLLDLQQEWVTATGSSQLIPQAGIVVTGELADNRPDVVGAILDDLERSVSEILAAEPATIARLSEISGLSEPLVEQVVPRLNLEVVPARDAQAELERFFGELAALSGDILGGTLPDDDFYLADPR